MAEKLKDQDEQPSGMRTEIAEKISPLRPREKPVPPITERYFKIQGNFQNLWECIVGRDVTISDMLKSAYWSQVAKSLRPFDKIVAMSEDRRLYVELIVMATGGNYAEVRLLGEPIVVGQDVASMGQATDYEVKELGLIKKWSVVNKKTGREISTSHSTRDQAYAWFQDWLKQQAA